MEENKDTVREGIPPQADTDEPEVVSESEIQEILTKYDTESKVRSFDGNRKRVVRYALCFYLLFSVLLHFINFIYDGAKIPLFLFMTVLLIFTLYPVSPKKNLHNSIPAYDIAIGVIGSVPFAYFALNAQRIVNSAGNLTAFEIVLALIGIAVMFEACRRVTGVPILCVAGAFILYYFLDQLVINPGRASFFTHIQKIFYMLFYKDGLVGTPIAVCLSTIVIFLTFGAFLEKTLISDFFIQVANSIAGGSCGGPAKVSVISSALCGMVSGSSVANTVTTGSVTIPMMKKTGYKPEFAAAVEATASTGGQIMPPIMGAAAFIMADMAGIEYFSLALKAVLPALLYFTGVFIIVHLEAKKLQLKGIPKENLPNFWSLILHRGYLLLPLVLLIVFTVLGMTLYLAALAAIGCILVVSMFRKETRITPARFLDALESGARSTLTIAAACGIAGIVAAVVVQTGLKDKLIDLMSAIPPSLAILALFLTMLVCILLGMGVPTTANFMIMATTCAPILITGMNIDPIAAYMFVFYFGIVADITPPVALAAYAGAAIAKADPMKAGFTALKLAVGAFIVPYVFALNPAMLFIDTTWYEVILIVLTSVIGMFGVSMGLEGYTFGNIPIPLRILSVAGGLLLIYPGWLTDVIGLAVVACVLAYQILFVKFGKKTA